MVANPPPIATDDSFTTAEDTASQPLNLLDNDGDTPLDTDTLSIESINGVTLTPGQSQGIPVPNGTINIDPAGVITFTPAPNFFGPVTFAYIVADGNGGTDTGTVNINVTSVNDVPVAVDDTGKGNEDSPIVVKVLANDSDVEKRHRPDYCGYHQYARWGNTGPGW